MRRLTLTLLVILAAMATACGDKNLTITQESDLAEQGTLLEMDEDFVSERFLDDDEDSLEN